MLTKKFDASDRQVVFVIDEHPIISFGLVEMVKDVAPQARTRQFSNLKDAARHAVTEFPALVITDFHLKDLHPESFVGLFEALFPKIPVLITDNSEAVMRQLHRYQMERFTALHKHTPLARIIEILRGLLQQADIGTTEPPRMTKHLTNKQVEVLELIGTGYSNREIGELMGISVETVKGHVKEILERMNARNRMEAAIIYRHASLQQAQGAELTLHNI